MPNTKDLVDLMANALDLEKSAVINEAVEFYAEKRKVEIAKFLDGARATLDGLSGARKKRTAV
jgi:predicted transcriptional regulator